MKFLLFFILSFSVFSYDKFELSCETSKQEAYKIAIDVFYPDAPGEQMYLLKSDYKTYGSTPVVSKYTLDTISSIKRFVSTGTGQFGSDEEMILVVLINPNEPNRRKAPEFYICYENN
jgi:hypothetical protein